MNNILRDTLMLVTISLLTVTVKAQTNATTITDGGYYRMYVPKSQVKLYSNNGYLQRDQATSGDNTDVFKFSASGDNYIIAAEGASGIFLGDFATSRFAGQNKEWLVVGETAQQWQITKNGSSVNYPTAWIIGKPGAELSAEAWMNYNGKGAVLKWKVVDGDNEDENCYFHLYPVRQYTIGNVSGAVEGMTLTATDENGYKSATAITTGNMFFFDADATLTEDRLSLSDASYNVTYTISGSVVDITLTKADKEAIIKANNGDATSLITNADCGDTAGWTNANPKTNQDGPYGLKISCFEQSSTNTVTQTLTDMPAGTYTMTVAVRGGKTIKGQEYTNTITVALNDSQTVVDLVDGNNENKGGTPWTAEYSEEKESGAYLGWKLATVKTTLSTKGNLTIALTPLSNVWTQIYDIHLEWESGATGIHELRMIDNNRQVYTLDGRNVTGFSLRKGIYIINGKKVIY